MYPWSDDLRIGTYVIVPDLFEEAPFGATACRRLALRTLSSVGLATASRQLFDVSVTSASGALQQVSAALGVKLNRGLCVGTAITRGDTAGEKYDAE